MSILLLHLLFLSASFGLFQGERAALFHQGHFVSGEAANHMFLFSSAHHNIFLLKIWIHQYSTCTGFGLSFVCVCLCHRLAGVSPQSPVRGFECDSLGGNCFTARLPPPPHPTPLLSQHPTGRILTKGDAAVNRACSLTKSCDVLPLADGVRHRQCALRMR